MKRSSRCVPLKPGYVQSIEIAGRNGTEVSRLPIWLSLGRSQGLATGNGIRNQNGEARSIVHSRIAKCFADRYWVPDHLYDEQATAFAIDPFRWPIEAEMEMVTVAAN